MARGGPREGAGRPKGARDKLAKEAAEKAASEGIMPLDYLLAVMRDVGEEGSRRIDAAKAAAPYVHPRLNAIEHTGKNGGAIDHSLRVIFD